MADLILYILVSVACLLGCISIVYQIIIQNKKKTEVDIYSEQMQFAIDQTTREMQKFFDMLRMKPTAKGGFGENVVEMLLSNLPRDLVKKQYQPPDISGRIDFTIELIESDLLLPIDSKFILPKELEDIDSIQLDKITIDGINKKVLRRAKEITKYADSVETTDFVLMFIPDFIYGLIGNNTLQELASMNIVPTNTSGLLSTIFMINMQNRFTKLNSAASKFGNMQMRVCQGMNSNLEKLKTCATQLLYSMNNVSDVISELSKLHTLLETLDVEEV